MNLEKLIFPNKKDFETYQKLKRYSMLSGIHSISLTVSHHIDPIHKPIDVEGTALTLHGLKYIEISYNLGTKNPCLILFTVAHELGHLFSNLCQSKKEEQLLDKIFKKEIHGSKITIEENSIIYKEEKTAWNNARKILIELDIYDCYKQAFEKDAKESLKTYKNLPKYSK